MLSCTKAPTAGTIRSDARSPSVMLNPLPKPVWNAATLGYVNVPGSSVNGDTTARRYSPPNLMT